tara:strand:+ start:1873 stop:2436 length:564 start_codon:yes stop_codon:yes gene_type:complete
MNTIPILYINLDKRSDRKKHIENELVGMNYERIQAIETPDNGYSGCVQSHIKALRYAKEKGYSEVIIIEDDFEFINKEKFIIPQIEFDVCMVSGKINKKDVINDDFNRVWDGRHTDCYLIKKHYYDTLIDNFEESYYQLEDKYDKKHYLDVYWIRLQEKDIFITPNITIGRQMEDFSDIQGRKMKRY